jgi:hypothetical protein
MKLKMRESWIALGLVGIAHPVKLTFVLRLSARGYEMLPLRTKYGCSR